MSALGSGIWISDPTLVICTHTHQHQSDNELEMDARRDLSQAINAGCKVQMQWSKGGEEIIVKHDSR